MTESARVSFIRWEDPPPSGRRNAGRRPDGRYSHVADLLRQRPGKWMVVNENQPNASVATAIRSGSMPDFAPSGDFDAVSRRINGKNVIYARYLGGEEA